MDLVLRVCVLLLVLCFVILSDREWKEKERTCLLCNCRSIDRVG